MSLEGINNNQLIAKENSEIFIKGSYKLPDNTIVNIKNDLDYSVKKSQHIQDSDFTEILKLVNSIPNRYNTKVEVTGESTFQAAKRMLADSGEKVIVLNFASATNPGGGYLNGARAQEEHLCRTSGLYPCLTRFPEFYEFHRKQKSFLYSDRMIYSPDVPIFREDDFSLQKKIYKVSVATSAAPALIDVDLGDTESFIKAGRALDGRIEKLLSLMLVKGYKQIVLGAWGCGAFKNDPKVVSKLFKKHLLENEKIKNTFSRAVFAVLDKKSEDNKKIFEKQFGS